MKCKFTDVALDVKGLGTLEGVDVSYVEYLDPFTHEPVIETTVTRGDEMLVISYASGTEAECTFVNNNYNEWGFAPDTYLPTPDALQTITDMFQQLAAQQDKAELVPYAMVSKSFQDSMKMEPHSPSVLQSLSAHNDLVYSREPAELSEHFVIPIQASFEKFAEGHADDFAPTQKREYSMYAHLHTPAGQHIYNTKEGAEYDTTPDKDVVLSGQDGEQWVVNQKTFDKTYRVSGEPQETGFVQVTTKSGNPCVAVQIPRDMSLFVPTSWGEIMQANAGGIDSRARHGSGDFLVFDADTQGKPVIGTQRVVEWATFNRTYEPVPGAEPTPVKELQDVPVPQGFQVSPDRIVPINDEITVDDEPVEPDEIGDDDIDI